jgi:hypothetical protein
LPYPQKTTDTTTASLSGELPFNTVVSAAMSPDGKEVIIKTYTNLYYWKRQAWESVELALQRTPLVLPYNIEPQGEAICFNTGNTGFFTLSEKPFQVSGVSLHFYKRN